MKIQLIHTKGNTISNITTRVEELDLSCIQEFVQYRYDDSIESMEKEQEIYKKSGRRSTFDVNNSVSRVILNGDDPNDYFDGNYESYSYYSSIDELKKLGLPYRVIEC